MFKYNFTDIKNRIVQLENPNDVNEHKIYVATMIDRTVQEIPSWCNITTISVAAFARCKKLTNVIIPNGVITIGDNAFAQSSLTSVTIPDSVTTIREGAFFSCTSLADMYLYPTTPPKLNSANAIPSTTTIHVHVGSGDAYKNATNWSSLADKIVEDIEI